MRITQKVLEAKVEHLNKLTGSPEAAYTRSKDGKFTANIGNSHRSCAYGGYDVHRMVTDGGGVTAMMNGHYPAKECAHFIDGMIRSYYEEIYK